MEKLDPKTAAVQMIRGQLVYIERSLEHVHWLLHQISHTVDRLEGHPPQPAAPPAWAATGPSPMTAADLPEVPPTKPRPGKLDKGPRHATPKVDEKLLKAKSSDLTAEALVFMTRPQLVQLALEFDIKTEGSPPAEIRSAILRAQGLEVPGEAEAIAKEQAKKAAKAPKVTQPPKGPARLPPAKPKALPPAKPVGIKLRKG